MPKPKTYYLMVLVKRKMAVKKWNPESGRYDIRGFKTLDSMMLIDVVEDHSNAGIDLLKDVYKAKYARGLNASVLVRECRKTTYDIYMERGEEIRHLVEGPVRASEA